MPTRVNDQGGQDIIKPNVILITTDQQRTDSLGCYGSAFVQTPHLDKMASQGLLFRRAYCTNPVCTPSRASIFSGCYASRHGAWNIGMNVSETLPTLAHLFSANGYDTHLIGKHHFNAYDATPEQSCEPHTDWEEHFQQFHGPYYGYDSVELSVGHTLGGLRGHYGLWVNEKTGRTEFAAVKRAERRFGGQAYDWSLPAACHNNRWIVERTRHYLQQKHKGERPFFLTIGFQDPHHPHALPSEWTQDINPTAIPPPDYDEGELDDKPPHFRLVREGRWDESPLRGEFWMSGQGPNYDYRDVSEQDARLGKAYYYKMCEMIDQAMGDILHTLDELQLAEETLVIFTADHGELLGDHGIWMKGPLHYEQLVRVPLIACWKDHLPPDLHIDSVSSLVDLAPTVLSLCDLPVPRDMNGLDCSAEWRGSEKDTRSAAMVEYVDHPDGLRLKSVVTKRYKCTFYAEQKYGELYDLETDPREKVNLWNRPELQQVKWDLMMALYHELERTEKRGRRYTYA